uniref:Chromo domain-containing protein n=1 Tax=Oncorhynchus tshawytscha TaxID=74940 RepID=A0AAZ3NU09_ONCTS
MAEKPEAGDSEDEVEDVYEVERIIDMRTEEGEVLYRVRWKNYSSDDDTWEPEAHLEDCREVLLGYKRALAEAKITKDQDAKKCMKLPMKSDVFDADSDSDSDIDKPTDLHVKKKKKKKPREEDEEEAPPLKEKRKKKKDKRKEDFRPRPAPESDEEELSPPPTPGRGTKMSDSKKRFVDSDEEEEAPVPSKKHRKDKTKDGGKHWKKENGEEGKKKKKKKKDRRGDLESTEDEATAPLEEELSEGPSESQTDDTTTTEKSRADDKPKNKKGKSELKLQGIKDFLQDKKGKKLETLSPMLSASGLAKLKSLTSSKSQGRDEPTPTSDSSDTPAPAQVHKKAKGKSHETTPAPPKIPSSSSSSSSSSSGAGASTSKTVEESKVVVGGDKEPTASTNLFEKFLLNCEAKDRVPRKQMVHQPTTTENTKPPKLIGKIEKRTKPTKESPARKPEPDKSKHTDAFRPSQSPGVMETGDRAEAEEEPAQKSKFGGEDRREEAQRWERRTQEDDRRRRRREDSEPRLFIACDDNQDPLESADKSDKGQASLNLGMDLNLDWMTLEDFQKHLNGEDEILSAPPLSPSELRDAVKSGDYMSVKLALNSKEDYNLDQEAYTVEQKSLSGKEKSLNEEEDILNEEKKTLCDEKRLSDEEKPLCAAGNPRSLGNPHRKRNPHRERKSLCKDEIPPCEENHLHKEEKHSLHNKEKTSCDVEKTLCDMERALCDIKKGAEESSLSGDEIHENSSGDEVERQRLDSNVPSGSDPLPSNAESSCEDEYEQYPPKTAQAKKTCRKIFAPRKGTRSSLRSSTKMTVSTCSTIDDDDKGKLDKKYFCLYCNEPHHNIARHLERMHAEEAAVGHAISFPKLSKIRSLLLDQLRNKGNDQHNLEILQCGDEVVTKKIPSYSGASVRDYLPCQHCVAFFNKIDLWKHESSCNARKGQDETRGGKRDSSGMSLSMLAAAGGQDDILRLLIKKGVKVNGRQKNGTTALMHAAEKNFLTTVAILLEAGSYVNAPTLGGETALMKACKRGNADVVRLLLEYGADCNILSKHKNTAMYFAKVSNNLLVCDLIKDHINMLSSVAEDTIRAFFETRLALLEPVFPLACHRLCEGPDFSLEFGYKQSPHTPGEGSGILLFIFHANFLSEITARLCGPCSVHAVVLNDKFQLPIFLDSHFIYSFSPVPGINKLFIRLAESPTAKVKLLICAYRVQLQ